ARRGALGKTWTVHVAVRVWLVLAQQILGLDHPLRIHAGAARNGDRLGECLDRLVLERQGLRFEHAPVELLLLPVEAARHRRIEQALVEVAVRLADAREGGLAPARAADGDQLALTR